MKNVSDALAYDFYTKIEVVLLKLNILGLNYEFHKVDACILTGRSKCV